MSIDVLRTRIAADLADDVARLLAGDATYDGRASSVPATSRS